MVARNAIQPNDGKPLMLRNAFIRRTILDNASLIGANLTKADMTQASARGANFKDAILRKTILRGADLTGAENLTLSQLAEAVVDADTILPSYINRLELENLQKLNQNDSL